MLTAKFVLTKKVDENGQRILEVGEVQRVTKEKFAKDEKKISLFEEFLKNVANVNLSKLTKKFTV